MTQQDRDEIRALVLSFSTRISDLPEVVALADGDYITVVQNDGSKKHSKKATLQSLLELIKVYYPDHNGAKYQGIAHPSDANVILPIGTDGFWFAIDAGIYANYGGIVVGNSPKVIKYNATTGEWSSDDLWGDINGTIAFRLKEGHAADSLDTYRIPVIPNRDYIINADCYPAGSLGSIVITEFNYEGTLIKRTELESVPLNFIPQSGTDYIQVTLGYNHSNPIAIERSEVTLTSSLRTLVEALYNFLVDVLQGEYEARFDSLEGDISSLFSGLSNLSDTVGQKFGGLEEEIQAIIRRLTDDEGNIAELVLTSTLFQTRLSDAEGNISTLRQTADEISAQVENAQGDIARLQIRADEISAEVRNAEGDISRISQRADQIEATVANQQGDISRITQRADLIETSVSDIEGRTSTLEQTAEHIQTTVVGIQGEISQITQRADSIESTVAGLEGDMSRITQRADSIESAVANLEGDVSQITQRADSIESTVSAIDGRTSTLEQRADGFDLTVAGLNEDIAELELTTQGLSVDVQNANRDIANLDVKADEIAASVQDANQNIASLEIRADGIESQVSAIDGRVSTVEQTANGLTVTVSALDGRVSTVEQTADGLVSTVSNLDGRVSTISQEVDRINLAVQAVSGDLSDYEEFVDGALQDIQQQIDGAIDTWFYDYAPVHTDEHGVPDSQVPLTDVSPYADWLAQEQSLGKPEQVRDEHVSDIFYDTASGYAYRFIGTGEAGSRVYTWVPIEDSAVIRALEDAARAQDTADNKRRVFLVQPTPPYDAGDLWVKERTVNGVTTREIYRCTVSRTSGTFVASDWGPADDYATTVNKANIEILADAIAGTVSTYQYDSEGKLTSETKNLIKQTANDTVLTITGTELETVGIYIHNASPSDNHIDLIADKVRIKGTGDHTPTGLSIVWDSTDQRYKIDAASLNVTGIFSTSAWNTQLTNINNTAQGYANTAQSNAEGYADNIGTAANSYADQAASDAETAAKAYADNVGSTSVQTAENYFNNIVYGEGGSAQQPTSGSILYTINNLGIDLSNLDDQINDTGGLADQIQTATQGLTDLGYLAEALLNGETVVAGGLIVSSLIQLGSKTYDGQDTPIRNADGTATPGELNQNTWKVWSGLNGVYTQSAYGGGIAAWYGGAMLDRYYSGNTDANRAAKSLFRFDGSGYLAKKNIAWEADGSGYVANNKIAWDTSGNLTVDGYVLTNEVQLKDSNSNIKAGISGAYNASATGNGIASWWGGEKLEKSVWDSSSASYKAAHEYARSLFRMDGSGYLANNNISWDAAGNLDVNGFVLTNEIQLKDSNGNVKAGISGRYNSSSRGGGLATWYGGPKIDHIDSPSATPYALTGFRFDGTGYLADGKIRWDYDQSTLKLVIDGYVLTNEIQLQDGSGNIQAGISGAYDARTVEQGGARGHGIAAWYGGPKVDHLQYPSATDYASSLFRMDGSGYLAGGELQWGASGELIIHGQSTENPITIENAVLSQGNLSVTVSDLIALKSWFTVESWTDSSGTHSYLKLNASGTGLEGFVSDGFISAGGLSPGSGTGGADLPAVWASLEGNSDAFANHKVNAYHIPIGTGLEIQNGLIVATNSGTVTGVSLAAGESNGTLHLVVNGTAQSDVAVTGLKALAYKDSLAFSEITGTASASQIPTLAISKISGLQTALDGKQPLDADLTAIAGLTGTSGFLKKTAANTWALDTNTYLTTSSAASTYVSGVALNGDYLRVTKNGTNTDLTIQYATQAQIPNWAIRTAFDPNAVEHAIESNYGESGSTRTNVPNEFLYGSVLTLSARGFDSSLSAQFLWDVRHGTDYSGWLWFRTKDSSSGWRDWTPVYTGLSLTKSVLTDLLESSNGYYVKKSGDTMTGGLNVTGQITPISLEFRNMSASAGNGGYIDFHFNNSSADFTTRIIESASGILSISGGLSLGTTLQLGDGVLSWDGSANAWKLTGNFYATGFISAGGVSSGGGTAGVDLTAVWDNLVANTGEGLNKKIHTAHLPTVTITGTNISGTGTYSGTGGSASTLTLNLTAVDTTYSEGTGIALSGTTFSISSTYQTYISNGNTAYGWGNHASAGYAKTGQANNFVHSSNEWTVIPSGYSGNLWLNYRTVSGTDGNLTNYNLGNGKAGFASVTASAFIKTNGTSSQFLKADGSVDSNAYITGNQTITLSGDVSGSGATSISVSIGQGKVTNAMLAGSIANGKLANSAITINGSSTSLGGSFSTASITAGTAGQSTASSGVSFSVPYVTMNAYGIVTGYGTHTHTISAQNLYDTIGSTKYAPYNANGYLPLSGGASYPMIGQLYVQTGTGISDATGNGLLVYHPSNWSWVTSSQWGVGATNCQGVIRSDSTDLIHAKNGVLHSILDASNWTSHVGLQTAPVVRSNYSDVLRDPDYHEYSSRRTAGNITFADGGLHYFLATASMTDAGRPGGDGFILDGAWDNGYWDQQLFVGSTGLMWRKQNGTNTWNSWATVWDSLNSNLSTVAWNASAFQAGGLSTYGASSIEFKTASGDASGGFIDFHYNGSTADYTSRIIENASGRLAITGQLAVAGALSSASLTTTGGISCSTLTASGNVGIGTTSPASKLHVSGQVLADAFATTNSYQASLNSAGWFKVFTAYNTNATSQTVILQIRRNFHYTNNETYTVAVNVAYNGKISFTQISGCANTQLIDKIRVEYVNSGSTIIALHYTGSAVNTIFVSGIGDGVFCAPAAESSVNGTAVEFTLQPNGVASNSNIVATGAITAGSASDARLKTNISTLSDYDARALIMALRPVTFTWNDKATELYDQYKGNDLGFVAQEVENVLPVAIGTIFEKYKRLDQTKFIAPLVAVAKDHETRIEKLEKEVKARDAKIMELESEIKRLRMN